MEIIMIAVLIVLCFFGFMEQEKNMKTLGEMIDELKGTVSGDMALDLLEARTKLAIAVKALEHASISLAKTDGDYGTLCVVRDALKEIQ